MNASRAMLLAGILLTSGCIMLPIPHDAAISPLFHGQVKDEATGSPIKNATASVSVYQRAKNGEGIGWNTAAVQTDADGYFHVQAVQREAWFTVLLIAPSERICDGTLVVSHPDYQEAFVRVSAMANYDCGRLRINRVVDLKRKK